MFENTINKDKKMFYMKVGGSFTPDEATAFINDYNNKVKQINAQEYTLLCDCGELKATTEQLIPALKGCMEMYIATNFKRIIISNFASASTKLQVIQLCKQIDPKKLEVVNSLDDAMKMI